MPSWWSFLLLARSDCDALEGNLAQARCIQVEAHVRGVSCVSVCRHTIRWSALAWVIGADIVSQGLLTRGPTMLFVRFAYF
jgi:hypothetical protein